MARRNDHTRNEIKTMAIEAGIQIAIEGGLPELSARKIATSIGYTVGTLYNIFENFDDLILHINGVTLDELHDFMVDKLKGIKKGRSAVKGLMDSYIEFATENLNLWNMLYTHNLHQGKEVPEWYAKKLNGLFNIVEEVLLNSIGGDPEKIKLNAKVLWASIHGITMLGLTGKLDVVKSESIPILTESLLEIFMSGLEK
jgi:AcrR family transcriptional regulator